MWTNLIKQNPSGQIIYPGPIDFIHFIHSKLKLVIFFIITDLSDAWNNNQRGNFPFMDGPVKQSSCEWWTGIVLFLCSPVQVCKLFWESLGHCRKCVCLHVHMILYTGIYFRGGGNCVCGCFWMRLEGVDVSFGFVSFLN